LVLLITQEGSTNKSLQIGYMKWTMFNTVGAILGMNSMSISRLRSELSFTEPLNAVHPVHT
jgi:hypothetical protein